MMKGFAIGGWDIKLVLIESSAFVCVHTFFDLFMPVVVPLSQTIIAISQN